MITTLACTMPLAHGLAGEDAEKPTLNLPGPTLGGKQFWADVELFQDWRIQRNSMTGHHRLLDRHDFRHSWGTLPECRQRLQEIKQSKNLPAMRGEAVIILHGMLRTRASAEGFAEYLRQKGGYTVFCVGYPTTQADIGEHAQCLANIIEHLDGIERINLVAYSLGNLVIRHYLADQAAQEGQSADPRIRRIVMLAPPNHGTPLANPFAHSKIFSALMGPSARQIANWPESLELQLATPNREFGIIAGGSGGKIGFNPLLPGDNDGVIPVESARLEGAKDFIVLPVVHTMMIHDRDVMACTLEFFQRGQFPPTDAKPAAPPTD
ncbi:MAG: esterase/lipase family protein [Pirellulales bacterium]